MNANDQPREPGSDDDLFDRDDDSAPVKAVHGSPTHGQVRKLLVDTDRLLNAVPEPAPDRDAEFNGA